MTFVTKLLQHTQEFNHDEKSRAQARHLKELLHSSLVSHKEDILQGRPLSGSFS